MAHDSRCFPLVVRKGKLKNHNKDQNKVVSYRNCRQVEGTQLGQHADPPQDDQKGDGAG